VSLAVRLAERVERDLALTRRLLDRLPDASMGWQPHPRSFSLADLATHLARLPHWGAQMLTRPSHDLATGGGPRPAETTRAAVLDVFDRHAVEFAGTLAAASDETLTAPWTLRRGDVVVESLARVDAVERYMLHHLIHHRGQLTVYLRLLDVALVPLYGPTADRHVS
jgi:uncharacterized damage-inducible protein DinB